MKVKNNYYSGQVLLKKILLGEPDDRSAIWINDPIGGTGKTAFMQTIIDDPDINGIYVKITEGLERLSSKVRKKIQARLDDGRGYPKVVWINFGRTVTEADLKTFSDFCEQLLDGMLDDNFGNSGTGGTLILPYLNVILTTNLPPNVKNLTRDRWHILSTYPLLDDESKRVSDVVMIPTYLNIKMILHPRTENQLVKVTHEQLIAESKYYVPEYSNMSYYSELEENIEMYNHYLKNCIYEKKYYKPMEAPWRTRWIKDLQEAEREVYGYGESRI